jgi:hypothetical protein
MRFSIFSTPLLYFLILIVILGSYSEAQQYGSLRGFVVDSTNGEALAFCNVFIKELNSGASTNEYGLYLIQNIPANKNYNVTVSYVGYQTKIFSIIIEAAEIKEHDFQLTPLSIQLQAVEKIGEKIVRENETDISLEHISIKQIETMPKGVEADLFKSIQYLPGVRSTGDISARYYVRGGTGNQNLVQINGIDIYNPFHALGLFSAIDPDMINSVKFYKSGFPSEFNGRTSSVLSVLSKDGNKNRFAATGSASFLTGKLLLEGPIPNGSFILTGRKSYSNTILKKYFKENVVPVDFYDISAKINYSSKEIFNNAKFTLFGYISEDNVDYDSPTREEFNWKNKAFGFQWLQIYDAPIMSRLGLSYSNFSGKSIPNESNFKPRNNELEDVSLLFDLNVVYESRNELGVGFKMQAIDTKLDLENTFGTKASFEKFAANISIYSKFKFVEWKNFGLDIGTRYNVTGLNSNGGGTFEPRANLTYRILPWISLKGSWGNYLQELTTISSEDEIISIFEPWIIIPSYLDPMQSTHYVIGTDLFLTTYTDFSVEWYYKKMKNIPIVNDETFESTDQSLISGEGESYGLEFLVNFNYTLVRLTTGYTISWAYRNIDEYRYYPNYDTRHELNLQLEFKLGNGWITSANWNYNSGLPFTEIIGYYDKFYFTNPYQTGINMGEYQPYLLLGDRNLSRLPAYHRLDLSLIKQFELDFLRMMLGLDVINVYDRQNIFYYDRETGEQVNMLPFMITGVIKIEI